MTQYAQPGYPSPTAPGQAPQQAPAQGFPQGYPAPQAQAPVTGVYPAPAPAQAPVQGFPQGYPAPGPVAVPPQAQPQYTPQGYAPQGYGQAPQGYAQPGMQQHIAPVNIGSMFAGVQLMDGGQRLPDLPLGRHRLSILGTRFTSVHKCLVVEFEAKASNDPSVIGKRYGYAFYFATDERYKAKDLAKWISFAASALGYPGLDALMAAGQHPVQLLDASTQPAGTPGAQPLAGRTIDADVTFSGRFKKVNPLAPAGTPQQPKNDVYWAVAA